MSSTKSGKMTLPKRTSNSKHSSKTMANLSQASPDSLCDTGSQRCDDVADCDYQYEDRNYKHEGTNVFIALPDFSSIQANEWVSTPNVVLPVTAPTTSPNSTVGILAFPTQAILRFGRTSNNTQAQLQIEANIALSMQFLALPTFTQSLTLSFPALSVPAGFRPTRGSTSVNLAANLDSIALGDIPVAARATLDTLGGMTLHVQLPIMQAGSFTLNVLPQSAGYSVAQNA